MTYHKHAICLSKLVGQPLVQDTSASAYEPPPAESSAYHKQTRRPKRGWNVQERANGTWMACASDPHTHVRATKVFDSKAAAQAWAQDKRAKLHLRQDSAAQTPLDAITTEYLIDLNRRCRSQLHITTVKQTFETLRAAGMTDLNHQGAVAQLTEILAGLKTRTGTPASPKTRNNFLVRVHALVNFAVKRDYLVKNRFLQIAFQKVPKREKAVFTLDEVGRLVDVANSDHPFYRALCCMLYTGFRQGEMRNMHWDWFLWDDRRIALTMGANATATLDADDDTFISKTGRERITRLMEELAIIMKPTGDMKGPVFPDLLGLDNSAVQCRFDAYLKHCKVTVGERTPHSCRHTWASLMLASGENQFLVGQYMGHADKEMTAHYARHQDRYLRLVTKAGWERGELRLRDFAPGGRCELEFKQVINIRNG